MNQQFLQSSRSTCTIPCILWFINCWNKNLSHIPKKKKKREKEPSNSLNSIKHNELKCFLCVFFFFKCGMTWCLFKNFFAVNIWSTFEVQCTMHKDLEILICSRHNGRLWRRYMYQFLEEKELEIPQKIHIKSIHKKST